MVDYDVIEKGGYNHPQVSGCISLKQYIFLKKNGKRLLMLRFANEFEHKINGFEIILTQLSGDGRVIKRTRIPYYRANVSSGDTFAPDEGIVVLNNCSDFRVKLVYFYSGPYKYVIKRGHAVAHYDPRGYIPEKTKPAKPTQIIVTPKMHILDGSLSFIAVISALLMFGVCIFTCFINSTILPF